jgi:hypothetical protein
VNFIGRPEEVSGVNKAQMRRPLRASCNHVFLKSESKLFLPPALNMTGKSVIGGVIRAQPGRRKSSCRESDSHPLTRRQPNSAT